MSISQIRPCDCPLDLRTKIEKVMSERNQSWEQAVVSLVREVVSPIK